MITYIWANTSSMNRFPHEQDCPYSSAGRGARLSSVRRVHSGHGRKIPGNVAMMSFADFTQSIPHTGHFMLLRMHVPPYKGFQMGSHRNYAVRESPMKKTGAVGPKGFEPMTARL